MRGGGQFFEGNLLAGIRRVHTHRHPRGSGSDLLEKFQLLPAYLQTKDRHPGDISAGPREADDDPALDWIGDVDYDDRNRPRRLFGRQRCYCARGDENVRVEPY